MTTAKRAAPEPPITFVGIDRMAQDLGDKHPRTVKRLAKIDPDFPPLVYLNGMTHSEESRWEGYKRLLIDRGSQPRRFPKKHTEAAEPAE